LSHNDDHDSADTLTKPCLVLMVHQLAPADRVRRPFSF